MTNKKLKEIVKQDFINKANVNLHFDLSKLESNSVPQKKNKLSLFNLIYGISIPAVSVGLCCAIVFGIAPNTKDKKSINNIVETKTYYAYESRQYARSYQHQSFSFNKGGYIASVNQVEYPNNGCYIRVSNAYRGAVNDFSRTLHTNLYNLTDEDNNAVYQKQNICFSPFNVYSSLNTLSLVSNDSILNEALENTLGLSEGTRVANYETIMKNDNFEISDVGHNGKSKISNGLFLPNKYNYNDAHTSSLDKMYTEIYTTNFESEYDMENIVNWYNFKSGNKHSFNKKELGINDKTNMLLFSTIDFDAGWYNPYYIDDENINVFTKLDGTQVDVPFMRHLTKDCTIYDYQDYYVIIDSYTCNYRIKYFLPKYDIYDIFTLYKYGSIDLYREDDPSRIFYLSDNGIDRYQPAVILNAPKCNIHSVINFKSVLTNMGLGNIFASENATFNNLFTNAYPNSNICLSNFSQGCNLTFDSDCNMEDATGVNRAIYSKDGDTSTIYSTSNVAVNKLIEISTVSVNLNVPFIYTICDENNIPLLAGHCVNPSL